MAVTIAKNASRRQRWAMQIISILEPNARVSVALARNLGKRVTRTTND
jgi:hypothetical protein